MIVNIFLFFAFLVLPGCTKHQPKPHTTRPINLIVKTASISLSQQGFVEEYAGGMMRVELYELAHRTLSFALKGAQICSKGFCKEEQSFYKDYFGMTLPDGFFRALLKQSAPEGFRKIRQSFEYTSPEGIVVGCKKDAASIDCQAEHYPFRVKVAR